MTFYSWPKSEARVSVFYTQLRWSTWHTRYLELIILISVSTTLVFMYRKMWYWFWVIFSWNFWNFSFYGLSFLYDCNWKSNKSNLIQNKNVLIWIQFFCTDWHLLYEFLRSADISQASILTLLLIYKIHSFIETIIDLVLLVGLSSCFMQSLSSMFF